MFRPMPKPPEQYAYGFGGDGIGYHAGLERFLDSAEWMGYTTDYTIEGTAELVRNNINKELVCFTAHGSQDTVRIRDGLRLHNSNASSFITTDPNQINIETITLEKPKLIVVAACETAKGDDNIAKSILDSGAKCVIGWSEEIFGAEIQTWMELFTYCLQAGETISEAYNFANNYEGYSNNSIQSAVLYGTSANQQQTLVIN